MLSTFELDAFGFLLENSDVAGADMAGITEVKVRKHELDWGLSRALSGLVRLPEAPISRPLLRVEGWHRPLEELVAELVGLQERGVLTEAHTVFFAGCTFSATFGAARDEVAKEYALALFEALTPLKLSWIGRAQLSVAEDEDWVARMANSGGRELTLPCENVGSANDHAVERAVRVFKTLHRYGVAVRGVFSWSVEDNADSFDEAIDFIEEHLEVPQLFVAPPPESQTLCDPCMSQGELMARYDELTQRVFSYPAIAKRALRHALRPAMGQRGFGQRFAAVAAPNLCYRALTSAGRERSATTLDGLKAALGLDGLAPPNVRPALTSLRPLPVAAHLEV